MNDICILVGSNMICLLKYYYKTKGEIQMKKLLLILNLPLLLSVTAVLNGKDVNASTPTSNNFQIRSIIGGIVA